MLSRLTSAVITITLAALSFLIVPALMNAATDEHAQGVLSYSFTNLGTLGGTGSTAIAINRSGQVVGYSQAANQSFHAFLYDPVTSVMTDLGTVAGASASFANALNDVGKVVGRATFVGAAAAWAHAFIYDSATQSIIDLHPLVSLGGSESSALAINNSGVVAGWAKTADGSSHAFIYNSVTGEKLDLGTLGGANSVAYDVNDAGRVVGTSETVSGKQSAFLYNYSTRTMSALGAVLSVNSGADSINNADQVMGALNLGGGISHVFKSAPYSPIDSNSGNLIGFGGDYEEARDFNNVGQIVGLAADSNGSVTAFVHYNGNTVDLNSFVPPGPHISLLAANGINDRGQIVGLCGLDGESRAFLLTPIPGASSPLTVNAGGPYAVKEGGTVELTAFGGDTAGGDLAYSWDLDDDGSYESSGQSVIFQAAGLDGPGSRTVKVKVTSAVGGRISEGFTLVNLSNAEPIVQTISGVSNPMRANAPITVKANFTDAGTPDSHTGSWDWGDLSTSLASVSEAGGIGSASGAHVYTLPGLYSIKLTVTDDDTGKAESLLRDVIVFDPSKFIAGAGWINSPAGAYVPNPSFKGPGALAFGMKYLKGSTKPEGLTEFITGSFRFQAGSNDWLIITGSKAQVRGWGKVNGSRDCGFVLTAIDGNQPGGGGIDRFRLKIWDKSTGSVVYDNQPGSADLSDPTMALVGGTIVIGK